MRNFTKILFFCVCLFFTAAAFSQTTYYVKTDGTGDGTSWSDASSDLQAMITQAQSGDQVWVAAGIYKPTDFPGSAAPNPAYPKGPRDVSFVLKNGVNVYGGFSGTETNLEGRDLTANETILSGDIGEVDDPADNAYHVVVVPRGITDVLLDGFTITGGNADETGTITVASTPTTSTFRYNGAAIYAYFTAATFKNLKITGNSSYSGKVPAIYSTMGGAVYATTSDLTFEDCVISENSTNLKDGATGGGWGAAIYSTASAANPRSLIMRRVTVEKNTAVGNAGAIQLQTAVTATLEDVDFIENQSGSYGGAVYVSNATLNMKNTSFIKNESAAYGGAIFSLGGEVKGKNVNLIENQTGYYGGGAIAFGSSPSFGIKSMEFDGLTAVRNKTTQPGAPGGAIYIEDFASYKINKGYFAENTATSSGGAIFSNIYDEEDPAMTASIGNSVFFNNESTSGVASQSGGGALFAGTNVETTITNSTFYGNWGKLGGGAIFTRNTGGVTNTSIHNSIFYNNTTDNSGSDMSAIGGSNIEVTHSITQEWGVTGTNGVLVGVNPMFLSTNPDDPDFLRLAPGSPAIGSGDNSKVTEDMPGDLGGYVRVQDDAVDMGAFETGGELLPVTIVGFYGRASGEGVQLAWSTAQEEAIDHYEVQRQAGSDWITLGQVASDKSSMLNQYGFTDNSPEGGANFYRLKIVGDMGGHTYSGIINVRMNYQNGFVHQNVPNPVRDFSIIKYEIPKASKVNITIFDAMGNRVSVLENSVKQPGSHQVQWNATNLPAGNYYYRVMIDDQVITRPMLKLK